MSHTSQHYIRQLDQPLYPKTLYNRPINRLGGGRLLIVGGHTGELSLPTAIHQLALSSGVGECRVILPDTLAKLLGGAPGTYFAPSTPSGSLSTEALGRILELSEDCDAVALGASLSNNSITTMLIEKLTRELTRPIIAFEDALPALASDVTALTERQDALVILTMPGVFKLCGALSIPIEIRPGGGLLNKIEIIRDLADRSRCHYAVYGTEIITASHREDGPGHDTDPELVVTPIDYHLSLMPALFPATLGTFWLQSTADRAAGLVTGAYVIAQAGNHLTTPDRPTISTLAKAIDHYLRQDDF